MKTYKYFIMLYIGDCEEQKICGLPLLLRADEDKVSGKDIASNLKHIFRDLYGNFAQRYLMGRECCKNMTDDATFCATCGHKKFVTTNDDIRQHVISFFVGTCDSIGDNYQVLEDNGYQVYDKFDLRDLTGTVTLVSFENYVANDKDDLLNDILIVEDYTKD